MLTTKLEIVSAKGARNPAQNQVYNSVKRFSLEGLSDLIRVLMESVDDALFELSDKVDNDQERNMYFEAMREIRLKRDGMKQNFDHEMQITKCSSVSTALQAQGSPPQATMTTKMS